MVPFWDNHSKVSFDVIWASECVLWTDRCPKRVANGAPKGIQNDLKTRVPTKTTKMWFDTLFATIQPCPPCLYTLIVGTFLGYLSGVPREVNKSNPPKHTLASSHHHLRGPSLIFAFPEGPFLRPKSLKTEPWQTCPDPCCAKVAPR